MFTIDIRQVFFNKIGCSIKGHRARLLHGDVIESERSALFKFERPALGWKGNSATTPSHTSRRHHRSNSSSCLQARRQAFICRLAVQVALPMEEHLLLPRDALVLEIEGQWSIRWSRAAGALTVNRVPVPVLAGDNQRWR